MLSLTWFLTLIRSGTQMAPQQPQQVTAGKLTCEIFFLRHFLLNLLSGFYDRGKERRSQGSFPSLRDETIRP